MITAMKTSNLKEDYLTKRMTLCSLKGNWIKSVQGLNIHLENLLDTSHPWSCALLK
jgi:hypothetical protein